VIVTFSALGSYGRFANGLFQVASTIGIARRNGFDFAFPRWINHDHQQRFGSTEDCDVYRHFVNPLPVYDGPTLPDRFIDWGYHDVRLTESVSLSGHLQSVRYFVHCLDEVCWWLRMTDEPAQSDYVGIHVRRGDYTGGYHPRVPESYYRAAMQRFYYDATMFGRPKPRFLVFSDDIAECKRMFGSDVDYSEGRNYLDDFRLLKRCASFIIANSAYSAMAAILGEASNKRVIAPRPWFGPRYTPITGEDIYSEGWQIIDYEA
jgi:hypothetical protein